MQPLTDPRKLFINRKLGKVSHRVADLVEPNAVLSVNKDFLNGVVEKQTLFHEIEVVAADLVLSNAAIERIDKRAFNNTSISIDNFIKQFFDLAKQAIYTTWDVSKFHFVVVLPKNDVLVMVKAIHDLKEQYGNKWLGRTFFIGLDQDETVFHQVLDYFGFDDSYQVVYAPFYEDIITFQNLWHLANGSNDGISISSQAVTFTQKIKNIFDSNNIQLFTNGLHIDLFYQLDLLKSNWNQDKIKQWFTNYYYSYDAQLLGLLPGQVICPVLEENFLNLIIESDIDFKAVFVDKIGYKITDGAVNVELSAIPVISPDMLKSMGDYYCANWKRRFVDWGVSDTAIDSIRCWTAGSWIEYLEKELGCLVQRA